MSSSVYQGLQSCLEPRLTEPRVLRLKMTPSISDFSDPAAEDSDLSATLFDPPMETHVEMGDDNATVAVGGTLEADGGDSRNGGWSSLQALSCGSNGIRNEKAVYVHPLTKQYSPATLSEKSLEMCTESLGSETGSDGSEIGGDERMSLFPSDEEISPFASEEKPQRFSIASEEKPQRFSKLRELRAAKKLAKPRSSFPPPLTSMTGPISIKVKPHREGGRLVMKAVSFPSVKPCFQVERGCGRLRLRLLKHCLLSANFEKATAEVEEEEEEGEEEEGGEAEGETEEETNESVGKRRRPSSCRCKDGGGGRKGLLNWEPFLVST